MEQRFGGDRVKVGDLVEWITDGDIGIITFADRTHAYIQWTREPEKSCLIRQNHPALKRLT